MLQNIQKSIWIASGAVISVVGLSVPVFGQNQSLGSMTMSQFFSVADTRYVQKSELPSVSSSSSVSTMNFFSSQSSTPIPEVIPSTPVQTLAPKIITPPVIVQALVPVQAELAPSAVQIISDKEFVLDGKDAPPFSGKIIVNKDGTDYYSPQRLYNLAIALDKKGYKNDMNNLPEYTWGLGKIICMSGTGCVVINKDNTKTYISDNIDGIISYLQ